MRVARKVRRVATERVQSVCSEHVDGLLPQAVGVWMSNADALCLADVGLHEAAVWMHESGVSRGVDVESDCLLPKGQ